MKLVEIFKYFKVKYFIVHLYSRLIYKMRPLSNLPSNNDAQLTN